MRPPDDQTPENIKLVEQQVMALLIQELRMSAQIQRIYDSAIRGLERRIGAMVRKIEAERKRNGGWVNPDWFRQFQRMAAIKKQVEERINSAGAKTAKIVETRKKAAQRQGFRDSSKLISAVVQGSFNRAPVEALDFLAGRMRDGTPLSERFQRVGPEAARKVEDILFEGTAAGENPRQMKNKIAKALETTKHNALTIARTETIGSHRDAALSNYRGNADVLSGWEWMATHDRRTCPVCMSMDGRKFSLNDPFATHPGCRCTPVPTIRGEDPWQRTLGREWLESQSYDVRKGILGVTGANLLSSRTIKLDDFVLNTTSRYGPGREEKSIKRMLADGLVKPADVVAASRGLLK